MTYYHLKQLESEVSIGFVSSVTASAFASNFYYSKHFVKYNDITKLDTPPEKLKALNPD